MPSSCALGQPSRDLTLEFPFHSAPKPLTGWMLQFERGVGVTVARGAGVVLARGVDVVCGVAVAVPLWPGVVVTLAVGVPVAGRGVCVGSGVLVSVGRAVAVLPVVGLGV